MGISLATRVGRLTRHAWRASKRIVAAAALMFVLMCVYKLTVQPPAPDAARLDQVVRSYVDNQQFMGAVLVARGDEILFDKAYGSANLERQIANTANTQFCIASLTKQFTAASILLLEERGKVKIDDPIKKYYADAPPTWNGVTLRHLLTHTSGIVDYTNSPDYPIFKAKTMRPAEVIALFKDAPLEFTPGEKVVYSNSGYILLGYVIEHVTGQLYGDFVKANIFTPLGMKDSGYDVNGALERRAAGYEPGGDKLIEADFIDMSIPYAAGALYSTTHDLLRWQRGLYGGKLLSAASLAKMTTAFKEHAGFGIGIGIEGWHKAYVHGGRIDGFTSFLTYVPWSQTSIVVLSNVGSGATADIANTLGKVVHGGSVKLISDRKEISLPPEVLRRYVGTYSLAPQQSVMITLEGNQLMFQMSGQSHIPMFAESATRFFLKAVDAQVDFVEEHGKVTHLVKHQNGGDVTAARISDTVAIRKEITLPADTLQAYVGTYALRPGVDLVVTIEGEHLIVNPNRRGADTLYAESADTFFSKRVDRTLQFHRGAQGDVTHLTWSQGQFPSDAPRKPGR